MFALAILLIVLLLITLRQILNLNLQIWQIMLIGAIASLLTFQISLQRAIESIDKDVILFLFAIFIIGKALEESGYLSHISYSFFKRARTAEELLFMVIIFTGLGSAILMNDTLAIIGTPLVLHLAEKHRMPKRMMLLALAFSITIGSVMSPIGNPQNLLIALNAKLESPFITFFSYLFLPTMINLIILFFILRYFYGSHIKYRRIDHSSEPIKDVHLAVLSLFSLLLLIFLIFINVFGSLLGISINLSLTSIAIISSLVIILFSPRRFEMIRKIDWGTLIFFAAMFVLMQAVWDIGIIQSEMKNVQDASSIFVILVLGIIVSQFISNVPFVALYLPFLLSNSSSIESLMALAAGSTIAGNFMILGAASNVIIIQNAEKKGATITAKEFVKIGIPLTIINLIVYLIFLSYRQ
ncbi:MAG: SLC13 family permease [Candidatus Micrarchaeota archaeon]|nr:SLC13 family permease [Candidatus Micrarchaeota archaeon]